MLNDPTFRLPRPAEGHLGGTPLCRPPLPVTQIPKFRRDGQSKLFLRPRCTPSETVMRPVVQVHRLACCGCDCVAVVDYQYLVECVRPLPYAASRRMGRY